MDESPTDGNVFHWDTPLTIPILEHLTDVMPISVQDAAALIRVGRIILNSTWTAHPTLMTLVQCLMETSVRDHTVHQTRDVALMLAWTELSEVERMTTRSLAVPVRAVLR